MSDPGGSVAGAPTRASRPLWERPFHGISGFILRRLALGVLTLVIVSVIVFAATVALPTDPARALLGRNATPDSLKALRETLHLNRPVIDQYWSFVKGLVTGNPGTSLATSTPVTSVIADAVRNSAFLVLLSAVIAVPLALVLGVVGALKRDSLFDSSSSLGLLGVAALPEFVSGIGLVLLFGTTVFQWLPPTVLLAPSQGPWTQLKELVLPVVTLALVVVPYIARFMRASMIDVLESEYVEMARLKGLPERVVILRHALPGALVPAIQAIALSLAYLAGGIVVVEYVFNYPGVGAKLVDAVHNKDLPVAQTVTLLIAAVYVVVNLLADVLTLLVSPRVRTSLK
jgi:peptide/nickel transport system permease protein